MKLYKYRSCNKFTFRAIADNTIWLANPSTFNDPFDCQRLYDYYGDIDENVLIYCMSESCTNHLLWGHYADGHRGICIEYEFPNKFPFCFNNLSYPFFPVCKPVRYVESMPTLHKLKVTDLSLEEKKLCLEEYIFTKESHWKYENEWRLAIFLEKIKIKDHTIKLPPNAITAIYLGCSMSSQDKEFLYKSIRHIEVELYQMEKKKDEFSLIIKQIPKPRPWKWNWFTDREKNISKIVEEYINGIVPTDEPFTITDDLINNLMIATSAKSTEQEFIIDRMEVEQRLRLAINNADKQIDILTNSLSNISK